METHLVIAGIFAITLLLAFFEDTIKDSHKLLLLAVYAVVFILMATTKSVEGTADALNYEERFKGNDAPLTELLTEPTFIYLSRLVQWMGGGIMVIFFLELYISTSF